MSGRTPNFRKNRTIPQLISDTRRPRLLPDTAWYKVGPSEPYEIDFQGAWANVGGSGNPDAQWHIDHTGENSECRVIGLVEGGEEGSVMFTLPEESRPRYREPFVCAVEGGGTANVAVYPNGDVVLESFNG